MAFTSSFTGRYLVAPFWDNIYLDRSGTISYETFESGYYLEQVNAYIQRQRQNTFQGTWMMNVYYKEVASRFVSGEVNDMCFCIDAEDNNYYTCKMCRY